MAQVAPFQPYRYSERAGILDDLVTEPYDKITPEMQARYLARSPFNLVRIILGERFPSDSEAENVYTRAAGFLEEWIAREILIRDSEPSLFAYVQGFPLPGTGEILIRKGFIGLGAVEEYEKGIVHRHERTLSGPKKDRRMLLDATKAHFGQIFMLYPDPEQRADKILDYAAGSPPAASVTDDYGTKHILYRISEPDSIEAIQGILSDKKLLIADGHHRYETALAYRDAHPELEDAKWVMMTFVNLHSSGLRILATHRVVAGIEGFEAAEFLRKAGAYFEISHLDSLTALTREWEQPAPNRIRIGVVREGSRTVYLLGRDRREDELDVEVLHDELLSGALGIDAEAVKEQRFLKYVRGADAAAAAVSEGKAQIAFLLEPTSVQQVADSAFNGRCMPQKSTDFYPKLLTGLTIYKLEK